MLKTFSCQLFNNSECEDIINHFHKMTPQVMLGQNVNPDWNGRLLNAYECEKSIKDLLHSKIIQLSTMISRFYNIDQVYPETIHIVSWGEGTSLGVHSDNTFIGSDEPHYSPNRNYSATFVLTDKFEGGNFFFQNGDKQIILPSRKGWGTVFGAGPEYAHGVTEVTSGHRYTVAVWYTKDFSHSLYAKGLA
jgi:predicted 2-oxoglutarate/Fe(II)-dependent dioxygenase YbiX